MSLMALVKRAEKLVTDNSPLILTVIGVTGTLSTAVLTGKAAIRAHYILEEMPDAETKEKVQAVWQCYISPVISGVFTISAIIFANRISTRRAAAMAAAYSLSEKLFDEYKDNVAKHIGSKNEERIRAIGTQKKIDDNPPKSSEIIIANGGTVLCYDELSGRYFESDVETIRKAENDINAAILSYMYASLHDLYVALNLPPTPYSSEVGWTSTNLLEFKFSTCLSEDNRPCISLGYSTYPVRDYY